MQSKNVAAVLLTSAFIILNALNYSCESPTASSNNPPNIPTHPDPADGAEAVPADVALAWKCSDPDNDPLSYYVHLGTESKPPPVAKGVAKPLYQPRLFSLEPRTKYHWRVVPRDSQERTAGPVWAFTTGDFYCRHLPLDVGNKWVYRITERLQDSEGPTDKRDATEYTYEVTDHKGKFKEADAYVVKITESGAPVSEITLAHYGNKSFIYSTDHWDFVIEDDMALNTWNDRGLISGKALEYTGDGAVSVPAGSFSQCKILYLRIQESIPLIFDNNDYYWEYYAPDTGLVYYRHYWQYVTWIFFIPFVKTGEVKYELASYEVKKRRSADDAALNVRAPAEERAGEPLSISATRR